MNEYFTEFSFFFILCETLKGCFSIGGAGYGV